ncbi:hypothetical protein M0802_002273 [Mischocyttarus mexicanus]|nr:hypothetical protein M0802_002273 [Mischocyttarus mexicanus]
MDVIHVLRSPITSNPNPEIDSWHTTTSKKRDGTKRTRSSLHGKRVLFLAGLLMPQPDNINASTNETWVEY